MEKRASCSERLRREGTDKPLTSNTGFLTDGAPSLHRNSCLYSAGSYLDCRLVYDRDHGVWLQRKVYRKRAARLLLLSPRVRQRRGGIKKLLTNLRDGPPGLDRLCDDPCVV